MIAYLRPSLHLVCEFSEVCLSYMQFHVLKGEKLKVRSGRNLNLSEILYLSWLPSCLMKMQNKKLRSFRVHNIFSIICVWEFFFQYSRARNSKVNGRIW